MQLDKSCFAGTCTAQLACVVVSAMMSGTNWNKFIMSALLHLVLLQLLCQHKSINQSKRKTSNANGQTNLGHKHKAHDHNHEATQPMVDLPHTS